MCASAAQVSIGGGRLANRLQELIGETMIEDMPIRFAAIATEIGDRTRSVAYAARCRSPFAPPTLCQVFFRRSISAAAGWSTAPWSIRFRFLRHARWAPAWSSPSIWMPTASPRHHDCEPRFGLGRRAASSGG